VHAASICRDLKRAGRDIPWLLVGIIKVPREFSNTLGGKKEKEVISPVVLL